MMNQKNIITKSSFWANLFKSTTEKSDLESLLLSVPMFKNFKRTHLKHLFTIVHNRVYTANEYVFYQGDPGIGLYIVIDGEILIKQTLESDEQIDLASLGKGDFFGELALLDDDIRSASAIAYKESELAVIFKPDLDKFIEKFPKEGTQILQGMAEILVTRLKKLNEEYSELYLRYTNKL